MNFLELAQRTRREIGASGDGPANVAGQTGYSAKIVAWVQDAYREVQASPALQNCLWGMATLVLVPGVASYTLPAPFARMVAGGVYLHQGATKLCLDEMPWRVYRDVPGTVNGAPISYAMSPNNELWLYPTPQAADTLEYEYERTPDVMADNVSLPIIPVEYHMAIVWRAVMYSAAHDENQALFQTAQANYRQIMNKLAINELPPMAVSGALV